MKHKLKSNNFSLKTNFISDVLYMLELKVCHDCKQTHEQAIHLADTNDEMTYIKENKDYFFPYNYDFMWNDEKIEVLLGTQCGAEYVYEVAGE